MARHSETNPSNRRRLSGRQKVGIGVAGAGVCIGAGMSVGLVDANNTTKSTAAKEAISTDEHCHKTVEQYGRRVTAQQIGNNALSNCGFNTPYAPEGGKMISYVVRLPSEKKLSQEIAQERSIVADTSDVTVKRVGTDILFGLVVGGALLAYEGVLGVGLFEARRPVLD